MILPKAPIVLRPQHGRWYMYCCFCGMWCDLILLVFTAYCRVQPDSFPKNLLYISSVLKLGLIHFQCYSCCFMMFSNDGLMVLVITCWNNLLSNVYSTTWHVSPVLSCTQHISTSLFSGRPRIIIVVIIIIILNHRPLNPCRTIIKSQFSSWTSPSSPCI